MPDYLQLFDEMVERLHSLPEVRVTHYSKGLPVSKRDLIRAEIYLDHDLPPGVADFYQQCDGLQLRWLHVKDPNFRFNTQNELSKNPFSLDDVGDSQFQGTGMINLLPLTYVFSDIELWKGHIWFEGGMGKATTTFMNRQVPSDDFRYRIRPFDVFSFYNNAAWICYPKSQPPHATFGSKHWGDYSDDTYFEFEYYLNLLLQTYGYVERRQQFSPNFSSNPVFLPKDSPVKKLSLVDISNLRFKNEDNEEE